MKKKHCTVATVTLGVCCLLALTAIPVGRSQAQQKQAAGRAGHAGLSGGPVLAQALAESMEHAAGDGPVCRKK